MNYAPVLCATTKALAVITRNSPSIAEHLRVYDKIEKFFKSLKALAVANDTLLDACFNMAYNERNHLLVLPEVVIKLIEWLPEMNEREQIYLSSVILRGCTTNYAT